MVTETYIPVRHSEIDKMGIVHHSNYTRWLEIARKDFLNKAGTPSSAIHEKGLYLPLAGMELKFKSPARYGDKIVIFTNITAMSCTKVIFEYKILDLASGKTIACGKTVHAWTDVDIKPICIEKKAPHVYKKLKAFVNAVGIYREQKDRTCL